MLKFFLSSFLTLIFTACTTTSTIIISNLPSQESIKSSTILKITIPVREHGYSTFKTKVFTTQQELNRFIIKINEAKSWNQKKNFLNSLTLNPIDFKNYNLLLYRITESSGSTVLAVEAPSGTNEYIIINIGRDKPEVSTDNMAYYALAYKVAKSVKEITFDNGVKKDVILNK